MCSNTTCTPSYPSFNLCNIDGIQRNHSSLASAATFTISILICIMSPIAVVGNTVIVTVIWRNHSLRAPSYILLCGLALTDLCTGLITQPLYVAIFIVCLKEPSQDITKDSSHFFSNAVTIAVGFGSYLSFVTALTITCMAIERWLHMSRRALVTRHRTGLLVVVPWLLPIPLLVYRLLQLYKGSKGYGLNIAGILLLLFCLSATSVAYFKVFKIIRTHRQQIQGNESTQNSGKSAIDLTKYKRSVFSILYILAVFFLSYLPTVVIIGMFLYLDNHAGLYLPFQLTLMLVFVSSSLNPPLYMWRMRDIRQGVKQFLKQVFCKENENNLGG